MGEPRDDESDAGALPNPSGSGELLLTEEVAGTSTAPAPATRGFRLSDDALDPASDQADLLTDEVAQSEPEEKPAAGESGSDAVELVDAAPQVEEELATHQSGEGVALLDASPDAEDGPPLPPPAAIPGPGPAPPAGGASGRFKLSASSARQRLSVSTPNRPLTRLAEFYGQGNDVAAPRRSSRRLGPLCHACGERLEGSRCGRCGEPASVRAQIEAASRPDAAPPVRMARSTPQAPLIAAAVRERIGRDEELSASAALAASARRRGARLAVVGFALFQGAVGLGVSTVTTHGGWLIALLAALDLALGAWAGRRVASGEGSVTGQVAAGGAMGAGCAVKVLIAAVTSDLSLVLAVAASVGASVLAAVVGTALGAKLADPGRAQA